MILDLSKTVFISYIYQGGVTYSNIYSIRRYLFSILKGQSYSGSFGPRPNLSIDFCALYFHFS